jgi:uncharacterized protein YndB with AHSA1/START domain
MTPGRVLVDIPIAAPPETVWRALRDPAEIRRWHGWEYDGIAAEIDEIYVRGAIVVTEGRDLVLGDTTVSVGPGTRLVVKRDGGEPGDVIDEGWIAFFHQLRFALERHPGRDRDTLLLAGGEPPAGQEWFRSRTQTGVVAGEVLVVAAPERTVVHAWGDDAAQRAAALAPWS